MVIQFYLDSKGAVGVGVGSLCNLLEEVDENNPSHVLMIDDFNYHEIYWSECHSTAPPNHRSHVFINKIQDLFLFQHITEFTRYRKGHNSSLLNLILTNEECLMNDILYLPPLGKNDHVCLIFNINMYAYNEENSKPRFAYHSENYQKMTVNEKTNRLGKETGKHKH